MKSYLLGIDIGGTKCAVSLGRCNPETSCDIEILDKIMFLTETHKGVQFTLEQLFENTDSIIRKNHLEATDIACIGISCGGPLDCKRGVVLSPPNLIGWDNIPVVGLFAKRYGVNVILQNDANACALAEWKFGSAKGLSNVIFLTFGTGMGSGLILNGRLYSGTNGMAGEIGHIRLSEYGPVGFGKSGSFEGFCSGRGIAQLAGIKVLEKMQTGQKVSFCESMEDLNDLNAKIVGDAAEAGDELAREIYRISGSNLGKALSILIDTLNPEMIVIGSIYARSEELFRNSAMEVIEKESLILARSVCKIVSAGLGDKIGDYAALAVAMYGIEDSVK